MNLLPQGLTSLPNELIIIIFEFIKLITDKRQFLKTCKTYNNLTKQSFVNYEKNYNIKNFTYKNNYCVEKFTLELCHDGYFNLIPEHYMNKYNTAIMTCLAYYNNVSLLEVAKSKGCYTSSVPDYAALAGHIPVLDWCYENECNIYFVCGFGIQGGHLHVLKWLQEHKYEFNTKSPMMCNNIVQRGHLEILKFARGIGCPWNSATYDYALKYGNEELIKWVIDNGCPTS